jgi:hypothetical protein
MENLMTTYRLFANCNFCEEGHPLPFAVSLQIESVNKRSVGDIYMGQRVPGDIASIMKTQIQCSNSGNIFVQDDVNKIYLIPTG